MADDSVRDIVTAVGDNHAALGSGGNETIRHKLTGATALLTSALATMSTLGCARD